MSRVKILDMIVTEEIIKRIDKLINRKMKKGFLAGLISFILAKITHLLITFAIGLWLFGIFGYSQTTVDIARIIDSPILGIIYLILITRLIYLNITKK